MGQVMINVRVDEDIKQQMEKVCADMGLTISTAFKIFAVKVIKEKRIPFDIAVEPTYRNDKKEKDGLDDYLKMKKEFGIS